MTDLIGDFRANKTLLKPLRVHFYSELVSKVNHETWSCNKLYSF